MKKTLRKETIAAMKELPQSVKAEADNQLTQGGVSYVPCNGIQKSGEHSCL